MKCLIVRPPFAEYIVNSIKTIEYRSRKTNIRGRVGIIESGTSSIIGDVELIDCTYNPDIYLWEWQLVSARTYVNPISIIRKKGTIVWQNIDYDYTKKAVITFLYSPTSFYEKEEKCHELEQEFITKYIRR